MAKQEKTIVVVKGGGAGSVFMGLFLFFIVLPIVTLIGCFGCTGAVIHNLASNSTALSPANRTTEADHHVAGAADVTSPEDAPIIRTWTDYKGRTIEAKLISTEDSAITLEQADGTTKNVTITKLSPADQAYLSDHTPAKPTPERTSHGIEKRSTSDAAVSKVSYGNFNRVDSGMTKSDVIEILGDNYEVLAETTIGAGTQYSVRTEIFAWKAGGFSIGNCNVTFQNDKVTGKAQFGLK